ncbi:MAG: hypothetical protein Q8L29_04245 [archaeon]|nr:hypothetical protein [archaeon]
MALKDLFSDKLLRSVAIKWIVLGIVMGISFGVGKQVIGLVIKG